MKKSWRKIAIVVGVIIVILLVLPALVGVNSFRPTIESKLSSALGRKVELGELSLSILRGSVSAEKLSIADDPAFSKSAFLTAKSLKIGVELLPLVFSKKLNVTGITVDEPSIVLLSSPNGLWNFSSLGGSEAESAPKSDSAPPGSLSVAELKVTDGKIQIGKLNSSAKPLTIDKLNIEIKGFSSTTQFPFTLTASLADSASVELEGKAGPLASGEMPLQASLKVRELSLASIGEGLGGIGNLEGTLDSDGKRAKVSGSLSLEKLKLAAKGAPAGRTVQVRLAMDCDLKKTSGTLSQGDISLGKAVARLTGGFQSEGESTILNMKLNAPGMPVEEVESLLPALGVTLPKGMGLKGGALSVALTITGPTDRLLIAGPIRLENTTLEGFDLGSKLSALSAFTGKASPSKDTTIQNASVDTRLAPESTQLNAINVNVPAIGVLTGSGNISSGGALNFGMMAELTSERGRGGIPFRIEGTAADPKIVPDVKGMAGSVLKQAIGGGSAGGTESKGLGGIFKKR